MVFTLIKIILVFVKDKVTIMKGRFETKLNEYSEDFLHWGRVIFKVHLLIKNIFSETIVKTANILSRKMLCLSLEEMRSQCMVHLINKYNSRATSYTNCITSKIWLLILWFLKYYLKNYVKIFFFMYICGLSCYHSVAFTKIYDNIIQTWLV